MQTLAVPFLSLLFAVAAAFLGSALMEIRQRQAALKRAQGEMGLPGKESLDDIFKGASASASQGLDKILPEPLRLFLKEKLERAGLEKREPGQEVLASLLGLGAGLMTGLILELGIWTLLAAFLGAALPLFRLNDQVKRREQALRKDLPDALDLMKTCVEAGLGFDQALSRVASRMREGALKREFEALMRGLSLGGTRREGLQELARRCRIEEIEQAVSSLLQSEKRGSPLGPALEAQSAQVRRLRSLRVKKAAAEAPLKMLFPLMAFILPVVFIMLFGPILLQWKEMGF